MSSQTAIEALIWDIDAHGDHENALRQIGQAAQQIFAADLCTIFAINPLTEQFFWPPTIVGTLLQSDVPFLRQPRPAGLARTVIEQGEVFVEHLTAQPDNHSTFTEQEAIESFAGLALWTQRHHRPLAVLYISFRQPHTFGDEERALLRFFARQASAILQTTWFVYRYSQVVRIGQEINEGLESAKTLFESLQARVAEILNTYYFFMLSVYQPQTDRRDLYMIEEGQYKEQRDGPLLGCSRWVIEHQQRLIIQHLGAQRDQLPAQPIEIPDTKSDEESLIFIPLVLRNVPLGILSVQHPRPHAYDDEDVRILELLGNHVALALSNIHLYKSLRRLNQTGQFLTQKLDSEQVLQGVVEQIRATTKADIVVLYPYEQSQQRFELPPTVDGNVLVSSFLPPSYIRPDDIVSLVIQRSKPLFARDSTTVYTRLGGNAAMRRGDFERRERIRSTAAVPLLVGEESVGVLFVNFRNAQRFDAPQKLLIEGLASYAAIAIKNARTFTSFLHQRLNELELFQRIQREISRTLDLDEVLRTILELANERVAADEASILLYNSRMTSLETRAAIGSNAAYSRRQTIPLEQRQGLTRATFLGQLPIRVANVRTAPEWHDLYIEVTPLILSELDVPLLSGKNTLGVINLESQREGAFTQADQDFLVTLATQAVTAIENAQAFEREKRAVDELAATQKIGREIVSQLDLTGVMKTILEHALEITRSVTGHIMLYDARRDDLYNVAERGVLPEKARGRLPHGTGIVWRAIEAKELLNVHVHEPPWNAIYQEFIPDVYWELAVPLLENGIIRGVINIESPIENPFTARDERLLTALADLAVIAIQNAERYEHAQERKNRLEALHEIDITIINQLGDPNQVMVTILYNALRLATAEIADLDLYEQEKIVRSLSTRLDAQNQLIAQEQVGTDALTNLPRGIMGYVAVTRRPYRTLGDAQQDPYYTGDEDVHSEAAVPLLSEVGVLIGVLNVESRREYAFDEDDLELLELFAGQAVIAIKNAQMYARAERELLRFRLLHQAGRELGEISNQSQIEQAYAILTRIAHTASQSQVIIRRYDADSQELHVVQAIPGHALQPVPLIRLGEGLNGRVAQERKTMVVPDVALLPADRPILLSSPLERSLVVTPIQFGDEYYGNLTLIHQNANHFLDVDVELFKGLATQLGLTIHRLEAVRAQQESEQRIKEAETMSSLGQAGVELAHRLGNDLGLVRSLVNQIKRELMRTGVDNPAITKKLDQIRQDVGKVLTLSGDLKRDLGSLREELTEPVDPTDFHVRELLSDTAHALPDLPSNIHVTTQIAEDTNMVHGVYKQIADILRNLFVNAVDAMPDGGSIALRARTVGNFVEIQVADTGNGISQEQITQIFALFYSTKGSSGFGLWSARRYALANGGDLHVVSQRGQGSTFTLILPRVL